MSFLCSFQLFKSTFQYLKRVRVLKTNKKRYQAICSVYSLNFRFLLLYYLSMKFTDKLEKQPKQTYVITANLAWSELEAGKEHALTHLVKTAEIEGFRKGKAPAKLVREKIGENKLLEEASREVITNLYVELLQKHSLRPYIEPKVTLLKAPVNGEWEIRFEIATAPVLTKKPDYKKIAAEVRTDLKKDAIWVPGKDKTEKPEEKDVEKLKNERIQKIFNKLVEGSEIEISPLILEEEVSRRLVGLYEEVKKLGLTVDQYLKSKNETAESLRAKLASEITEIYKSELMLDHIAEEEKIEVDEKELNEIFKTAKNDQEKAMLKENAYIYARLMRKQKTLDRLGDL
jgi:FKBP-type peptidyl-prolyl cis-trans isomerase (trigger factor)